MKKSTIVFGAVMAGSFFTNAMAKNTFENLGTGNDVRDKLSSQSSSSNAHSMEFSCSSDTSKMKEAKCGEGKCGEVKVNKDTIIKAAEGKCGDKKTTISKTKEATCGDKKAAMTDTKKDKKAKRKAEKKAKKSK